MQSIKLNFSANVKFGLESENFRKFKTLLSESFGGNCVRPPRLTAVCQPCNRTLPRTHTHAGIHVPARTCTNELL